MLQLPNVVERSTLARLLILTYIACYFAVTLFKLVQSICITALIILCVGDQVLGGISRRQQSNRANDMAYHYPKVQQRYNFPWDFESTLDPLSLLSMDISRREVQGD